MSYSSRANYTFVETMRVRGVRITPTTKDGDRAYILTYAFPQTQLSGRYYLEQDEEHNSLAFAGIEGIGEALRDIVEECEMEVVILPATYLHSDLAKEIFAVCKP